MTPSLAVTRDAFVITIPRSLFREARLDREILAALAAALSIEGLNEAASYFSVRAKMLGTPSIIDSEIAEAAPRKQPSGDQSDR